MITPVGFSNYKVKVTNNGLQVYKKKLKLTASTDRHHNMRKFRMIHDNGKKYNISELRLSYALEKGVDVTLLDSSVKLMGTVDDIHIGERFLTPTQKKRVGRKNMRI